MSSIIALATLTGCGPTQPNPPGFTTDPSLGGSGSTSAESSSGSSSAPSTGGESMTADPTTSGTTTTGGTSTTAGISSTASTNDVGSDTDLTGDAMGCGGKIDLLFVISRDHTLNVIQAQLIDAFPKFIDTIDSKFEDFDFHIMVVDATDYWGVPWWCTDVCPDLSCLKGDPCCVLDSPKGQPCCSVPDYPCEHLDLVSECSGTLGSGVIFPAGPYATNAPCKVEGGRRYLTKGQSDLSDTFTCIAQVGTGGSNQVGAALAAAVDPSMNAPGGCNDGFLRDDALLMVTLVTPGSDDSFTGSVKEWYEAVLAAKKGDPEAVVMLLIGNPECPDFDDTCKLAKKFPNVLVSDSDDLDYGPAFDEASTMAEDACKVLIPG